MSEILYVSIQELGKIKLSLNAYLALLMLKYGNIRYTVSSDDYAELSSKGWIDDKLNLSEKATKYFKSKEAFKKFFYTFPHTVPTGFGEERPLRTASHETNAALITETKFSKKTKGNSTLQDHIIDVLKAEINWRRATNSMQYMNNIDTWLNQNNYEKYDYLLANPDNTNFVKRL